MGSTEGAKLGVRFSLGKAVAIMRATLVAALALSASLTTATAVEAGNGQTVPYGTYGYWSAYAWYTDSGAFGHCGMGTGSRTGSEHIDIIVNPNGIYLFLDNPEWQLPIGETYSVEERIGGESWGGRAKVYGKHGVVMSFPWTEHFGQAFIGGSQMNLTFGSGKGWNIDLQGTRQAMDAIGRCLQQNQIRNNPFAPNASNPFAGGRG
jgi:hypothetical protein